MKRYYFLQIIICVISISSILFAADRTRELLIFPDANFSKLGGEVDPTVVGFMQSIFFEYPILVSGDIWRIFALYRKKAFDLFTNEDEAFYQKVLEFTQMINKKIAELAVEYDYNKLEILDNINALLSDEFSEESQLILKIDQDLRNELKPLVVKHNKSAISLNKPQKTVIDFMLSKKREFRL